MHAGARDDSEQRQRTIYSTSERLQLSTSVFSRFEDTAFLISSHFWLRGCLDSLSSSIEKVKEGAVGGWGLFG